MKSRKQAVQVKTDTGRTARQRARATIGPVKPARAMTPKSMKPPRYKKSPLDEDQP